MDEPQRAPELNPEDFTETPEYSGNAPPAPQPEVESYDEGQSTGVIEAMKSRGYDVGGYEDDEALIKETEARYAAAVQAEREMAQRAQSESVSTGDLFGSPDDIPSYQYSGNGQPEYDESWAELVEQDPSGRFVIRNDYVGQVDPSVADKVNKYVEWRQSRSNELIDDPVNAVMAAGLEGEIQSRIDTAIKNAFSKNKTKSNAESFIKQNEKILYVQDPQTGTTQVDSAGKPVLSPVGRALNDAHVMLRQNGMTDPQTRHKVATQMVQNYFTQQQLANGLEQQPPQPAQQQRASQQSYKDQYTDKPFSQPTNPHPPGYMPNTPTQPQANYVGPDGLPEHTSLGSLATALAVHKGYLQPKG